MAVVATHYDLTIIGGGSAGLTAARFANRLGKRVALIEANRLGGDCTWTGCVPSKALLHAANLAHAVRNADQLGIAVAEPPVDFAAVMARIQAVIQHIYADETPNTLRSAGIDVIEARAEFLDSHTVVAGGQQVRSKIFLICTGASPFVPPIPGLNDTPYLTYESFWEQPSLPARLIVIGGGPIGCELAQACQRLGSQVMLVEALDRILPNDDPQAADLVASALVADGIDLRLSTAVESVRHSDGGRRVTVTAGGCDIAGDALLVAAGRRANIAGLGLENAGVAHTDRGVTVNDYLRTNIKNIYAAGDCAGGFQFTHYAGFQAAMAVRNALLPGASRARPEHVPWATFTDPEVAQTGQTEEQARQRHGDKVQVFTRRFTQIDRAVIEGAGGGFIKVVSHNNGKMLGATVVGPRAADVIQEWTTAIDRKLRISDVIKTMHVYPTVGMGNQQLAWEAYLSSLTSGWRGRLLRWLSR